MEKQIDIEDDHQSQYQNREPEQLEPPAQPTASGPKVTSSGRVVKMLKRYEDFLFRCHMKWINYERVYALLKC